MVTTRKEWEEVEKYIKPLPPVLTVLSPISRCSAFYSKLQCLASHQFTDTSFHLKKLQLHNIPATIDVEKKCKSESEIFIIQMFKKKRKTLTFIILESFCFLSEP